ncbi:TerB family tellurite resistance protein [Carboxylicivirga sp. N1Y90]|uniref:tellurite resistance TerB family protein n=1 Tax=Carboxylicivirga fragile TaxID=3417571 RepID=UPI003D346BF2|nr:TerB family tellurite resistance protein [Marinilabiliaceae bacterium N1Y90]
MKQVDRLYEVLGELLYAIAKADGVIQKEEKDALKNLLSNHSWGSDILWSFEYEASKDSSVEEIYNKVINFCHSYGPAPQYEEFIKAMNVIAEASNGVDADESKIISSFSKDLLERFKNDLERLSFYEQRDKE